MSEFHCVVEARPQQPLAAKTVDVCGQQVQALSKPSLPSAHEEVKFATSFEAAAEALNNLPRMYFELDGSFVWVVEEGDRRFQLDGSLYDDGRQLLNVDLKGSCNASTFDRFISCLGWPQQELIFQLVQQGIYLDETSFRRCFISN